MTYEATAQVVVGLFKNANDAHQAVTQLRANGFSPEQIGAAFRGLADAGTVDPERESWWNKVKDAFHSDDSAEHTREARDMATDTYSRSDYEYDDFQDSLAETGIPSSRAAYLTRNLEPGGAIVTVRDANRAGEAGEILSANHGRVRYEDASGIDDAADIDAADKRPVAASNPGVDRVQLFGEVLRVHKERISRGEVRVHKDVVTENQTIEVPVTREELVLERVAVSGNTPAPSANIGSDQEIRVPLSEEQVRLEKQPVVREEVVVGKREVADVATVGDDVRHEELRVDDSNLSTPKRTAAGQELPDDVRRHG